MVDEVTQLPNRRLLQAGAGSAHPPAATERFSVTVVIFDLDGSSTSNDTYGHNAGDPRASRVGTTHSAATADYMTSSLVSRAYEFVVAFWDADEPRVAGSKHPTDALMVLDASRKRSSRRSFANLGPESKGRITISGGLASFPGTPR